MKMFIAFALLIATVAALPKETAERSTQMIVAQPEGAAAKALEDLSADIGGIDTKALDDLATKVGGLEDDIPEAIKKVEDILATI
jgi:uncharacterized protein YoxC